MWQTRWAAPQDLPALLALFERAFGHPMPQTTWEWKYRYAKSPGMVCLHEGNIIAFNGGMPRNAVVKGSACSIVQMGDVMVDPKYQGILTRRGPFYQVVQAFLVEQVGAEHAHRYAFGFPHARHARLGNALKLYYSTDRIDEAHWPAIAQRRWRSTASPLLPSHAHIADKLWNSMANDLGGLAIGVRDWSWLTHRYFNISERGYIGWLISERLTRRPLGICILRQHDATTVELLDIVCSVNHMPEVVRCAQHITSRLGARQLMAWLTPSVLRHVADTQPTVTHTEVVVPGCQVNDPTLTLGMEVADCWWLMGGDTDFR